MLYYEINSFNGSRTEYWKSNTRKFCEYCKCWFADNKASINFHEAGELLLINDIIVIINNDNKASINFHKAGELLLFNDIIVLWDKVYPIQVTVPPMGGNFRLLR